MPEKSCVGYSASPKQPEECHGTYNAPKFCGTDLLKRKKYCTFTHSALLWKKLIEAGEGWCSTGIVQVCIASLFLMEAVLPGSVSCGKILQSRNTTTNCEHSVGSLAAGCYQHIKNWGTETCSASRAFTIPDTGVWEDSLEADRHGWADAPSVPPCPWVHTQPHTAAVPGGMGWTATPAPLISFAGCQGMPGDGSWAAPRGVPSRFVVEPGQYWTAAPDTIICFQRANRKQRWRYFAWASQVLMRLLLPYASFPYNRELYFSSSRQDSWESHTEKTPCKNPNAETHWCLSHGDLNANDFKDYTLKRTAGNWCKRKIIDHPRNTRVDRSKSLFMQKPLSLSDLILMAILS